MSHQINTACHSRHEAARREKAAPSHLDLHFAICPLYFTPFRLLFATRSPTYVLYMLPIPMPRPESARKLILAIWLVA
jgi:hypothetical protein